MDSGQTQTSRGEEERLAIHRQMLDVLDRGHKAAQEGFLLPVRIRQHYGLTNPALACVQQAAHYERIGAVYASMAGQLRALAPGAAPRAQATLAILPPLDDPDGVTREPDHGEYVPVALIARGDVAIMSIGITKLTSEQAERQTGDRARVWLAHHGDSELRAWSCWYAAAYDWCVEQGQEHFRSTTSLIRRGLL